MRQDLQVKLLQSEQQLAAMKASLSNGPSMELTDFSTQSDITPSEGGVKSQITCSTYCTIHVHCLSLPPSLPPSFSLCSVVERETCRVQIPKGHNPRKQGWREVVSETVSDTEENLWPVTCEPSLAPSPPPSPPLPSLSLSSW